MGPLPTDAPTFACHSASPVVAFKAAKLEEASPLNTRLPAVLMSPERPPPDSHLWLQRILPVLIVDRLDHRSHASASPCRFLRAACMCGDAPLRGRPQNLLATRCVFWHTFIHDTSTSSCCSTGGRGLFGQRAAQPPVYQGNLLHHFPERDASPRVLRTSQVGGF